MENKSEFLDFIVKNNLIDNTYPNYLVRTSKNGLKQNERNFLNYVITNNSEKLKEIQTLDEQKIPDILRYLSDHHFSVKNFTNESIYDYFNKPELDQTLQTYLRKLVIIDKNDGTKNLNTNFLVFLLNKSLMKKIEGDYIFSSAKKIIQENIANLKPNDNLEALLSILLGLDFEVYWTKITRLGSDAIFSETIDEICGTNHSNQTLIRNEIINQIRLKLQSIKFEVKFNYIPFSNSIPQLSEIEEALVSYIITQKKYSTNERTLIPIISHLENRKIEGDNLYDIVSVDKSKKFIKGELLSILNIINTYNEYKIDDDDYYITSEYENFSELYNIVRTTENSSKLFKAVPSKILWKFVNDKMKMDKSESEIIDALKIIDSDYLIKQLNEPNFKMKLPQNKDSEIIKYFKTNLNKSKITNENLIKLLNSNSNLNRKKNISRKEKISELLTSKIEINLKQVRQISTKDIIAFDISKNTNEEKLRYKELIKVKISTLKNESSIKKLQNLLNQL